MIEENNQATTTAVVKVRKKPGPKPKNKIQEEVTNSGKNVAVLNEAFNYDYVIKVLDEAKDKRRKKEIKEPLGLEIII